LECVILTKIVVGNMDYYIKPGIETSLMDYNYKKS
jgi:hypothetical protein